MTRRGVWSLRLMGSAAVLGSLLLTTAARVATAWSTCATMLHLGPESAPYRFVADAAGICTVGSTRFWWPQFVVLPLCWEAVVIVAIVLVQLPARHYSTSTRTTAPR